MQYLLYVKKLKNSPNTKTELSKVEAEIDGRLDGRDAAEVQSEPTLISVEERLLYPVHPPVTSSVYVQCSYSYVFHTN